MPREREPVSAWLPLKSFLAKGPRYLWTYALWRGRRAVARRFATPPRWPEDPTATLLAGKAELREHFLKRERPAPLVTPSSRDRVLAAVPAEQRERTCRAADAIVARRFCYRGLEVSFARNAIDWQACPGGNTDWTWDLNRHHFAVELGRAYNYTGDEQYAQAFRELFLNWIEQNPPGVSAPCWKSVFEVGVRTVNWCWAHALFLASPALDDDFHRDVLRGFLGTGKFLQRHLERHAWNNHLLLEAKALAMLGLLYPELPGAASWASDGLHVLGNELRRQVCDDGVHSERSTFYHKLIASELLELLVVLRQSERDERSERSDRSERAVTEALGALCRFLQAITRDDGSIPLFGDASRHDAHIRFDALEGAAVLLDDPALRARSSGPQEDYVAMLREGTAWLLAVLGRDPSGPSESVCASSVAFPSGGYWVLRAAAETSTVHLMFDCGPFGDPVVVGHGHADALSIDLAVGDQHVLVDPGMYSAHLGEDWRNYFRGTASHNTVRVDERDQSVLVGLRRVYFPASARCTHWRTSPLYDHVRGMHDGYRRLSEPIRHEREILFVKPDLFTVIDSLDGQGEHGFESFFHFPPGASVERHGGHLEFRGAQGRGVVLARLGTPDGDTFDVIEGRETPPGGWVAYRSGVKEPAPTACYRVRARTPVIRSTVLAPLLSEHEKPAPRALELEREGDGESVPGTGAIGLTRGDDEVLVVVQGGHGSPLEVVRVGAVRTDARVLVLVRRESGALRRALVLDGTFLEIDGDRPFTAGDAPADYAFDGERWELEFGPSAPAWPGG